MMRVFHGLPIAVAIVEIFTLVERPNAVVHMKTLDKALTHVLWKPEPRNPLRVVPPTSVRSFSATRGYPVPIAARPAQPAPEPAPLKGVDTVTVLESEHFTLHYQADKLSQEQAQAARREAERGWERCARLFGAVVPGKIRLELTPDLTGAAGTALLGDPVQKQPRIQVRYAELEYLGLSSEYLLTHEIAHVFSGALARSSLGEGIADWAAGVSAGIRMRPWWGRALREAGLWVPPDALFITGAYQEDPDKAARNRTVRYMESGLLVQYLIERFGWEKFRAFAADYGEARGWLGGSAKRNGPQPPPRISLPVRIQILPLSSVPPLTKLPDLRLPPALEDNPAAREPDHSPAAQAAAPGPQEVRRIFERHFGMSWEVLRGDWERRMEQDRMPRDEAQRLVLSQQIYGAVRGYELWKARLKHPLDEVSQAAIRTQFVHTNRLLWEGDLKGAVAKLHQAQALVEQLRRRNPP